MLIAKSRLLDSGEADLEGCIERLKTEKGHLFGAGGVSNERVGSAATKTAGVRDRLVSGQTILEKAAKKAAGTGSRADLQEYLKLRRNFL